MMLSWLGRLWVGRILGCVFIPFALGDSWCLRLGIPFARSLRRLTETLVFTPV